MNIDLTADAVVNLARALFGPENKSLSNDRELRFGRHGSVAVVPSRGVFADFESGQTGGILDMIVHAGAAPHRRGAADLLKRGACPVPRLEDPQATHLRQAAEDAARRTRAAVAARLWASGAPLSGSVGDIYLRRARCITAPLGEARLRLFQAAPLTPYRPDRRTAPAIVAAVVDPNCQLIGAHLTYLARDGSGKARIASPRKMVGAVRGGHVPLIAGATMVVAEGIESALSAWEAFRATGREAGALAALSAGGLAGLNWPLHVTKLVIAPDRDLSGAGLEAAKELARRADNAGLEVDLLAPPEGFADWNDAAMGRKS